MHVLVWFLLIVETESGSSMHGAVDARLLRRRRRRARAQHERARRREQQPRELRGGAGLQEQPGATLTAPSAPANPLPSPQPDDSPPADTIGGGGAPEIASLSQKVFVTIKQSRRGMVETIDFFTSFGHGEGGDHRRRLCNQS